MMDITWLKSPVTGIWYYAYVIEDLYDRSIVAWMIFENESDVHNVIILCDNYLDTFQEVA